MLTSISPLGERARGQRWALTATAYVVGSLLGGGLLGAALGSVGGRLHAGLGVAAVTCLLAAAADAGRRLPTPHRQVDEDWLSRYRGWVYGLGYGLQLGLGLVTIVTSAATYAAFGLCLAAGGAAGGGVIGGCFGLVRSLPLLLVRRATTPDRLREIAAELERVSGAARRLTIGLLAGSAAVLVAAS